MTTLNLGDLMRLGFNRNEAITYNALVTFGRADASQLIRATKFHKNIVYDNLAKLIDKGLVSYIKEDGKRVFQVASGDALMKLFEQRTQELEAQKRLATTLSKEVDTSRRLILPEQEASLYRGVRAIKSFYDETLAKGDYVIFGAPETSVSIMGEAYWIRHNRQRDAHGVKVRMIFNPSIRSHGKKLRSGMTRIRYFKQDFEPLTETHIQGDVVAIIVWTDEPILIRINDRHVASAYLAYFEEMWRKARP
jgi:sugar-specific transcriptional regulator TrmB